MNFTRRFSLVVCSHCGGDEATRSHRRNLFEQALRSLITPWRCNLCGERFFSFSWIKPKQKPEAAKHATPK